MAQAELSFKHLQAPELQQQLADGNFVVVDIRDQQSFQAARIPNAIHLTNENLADFIRDADLDKPTVVCCYHGMSSQQAAQFLVSQDFSDVYSLDGGFAQWQALFPADIEQG